MFGNRDNPVRMRMHIDEARRDDETGSIDVARGSRLSRLGGWNQFGDFSATQCEVGFETRGAAAVDDGAAANNDVVFHGAEIFPRAGCEGNLARAIIARWNRLRCSALNILM